MKPKTISGTNLKLLRRFLREFRDSPLFAVQDLGLEVFAHSSDGKSWRHTLYLSHSGEAGIKWYENHRLVGQWAVDHDGKVRPIATPPETPLPKWLNLPDQKGSRVYRVAYHDWMGEWRNGNSEAWNVKVNAQSADEAALIVIATFALKYHPYYRWSEGYWMDTINHTTRVEATPK